MSSLTSLDAATLLRPRPAQARPFGSWPSAAGWLAGASASGSAATVWLMLGGIWLLSAFDYVFTVSAVHQGLAEELNPLAAFVMQWGAGPLLCYKCVLLLAGSVGLAWGRQAPRVRVLGAVVLAALVVVMLRWAAVYALYEQSCALAPPGYPLL